MCACLHGCVPVCVLACTHVCVRACEPIICPSDACSHTVKLAGTPTTACVSVRLCVRHSVCVHMRMGTLHALAHLYDAHSRTSTSVRRACAHARACLKQAFAMSSAGGWMSADDCHQVRAPVDIRAHAECRCRCMCANTWRRRGCARARARARARACICVQAMLPARSSILRAANSDDVAPISRRIASRGEPSRGMPWHGVPWT